MWARARTIPVWVIAVALLVLLLGMTALAVLREAKGQTQSANSLYARLAPLDGTRVTEEKLRQETVKVEVDRQQVNSARSVLASFTPLLTALVAIGGAVLTLWKQMFETSRQREQDRLALETQNKEMNRQRRLDRLALRKQVAETNRQRKLDRHQRVLERRQREDEILRRTADSFTAIVGNLCSDQAAIQAAAATSIVTFLNAKHQDYHGQVYTLLLARLKTCECDPLRQDDEGKVTGRDIEAANRLMIAAFEKAIRVWLPVVAVSDRESALDLSGACLKYVNLSGLHLDDADLAFARLEGANLIKSELRKARGYEVNLQKAKLSEAVMEEARLQNARCKGATFNGAKLGSAKLQGADFKEAMFMGAYLQSAHFERTNLKGTRFDYADLSDTFFHAATIDATTKQSILRAKNWLNAHYDNEVLTELKILDQHRD